MELPSDDQNTISVLIKDPVHYVARYIHHDFQSVVASCTCGLLDAHQQKREEDRPGSSKRTSPMSTNRGLYLSP